jgi:diketogulonate reductase-like aldo/keto reductase
MELRELGGTGVMLPEVGSGTWRYRGGVAPLQRGLELGAFLIDTAEIYRTEDVVGEAIRGRRDEVFVATKVSADNLRYDAVLRAAEGSLKRLGIETIDLYQIHWPNSRVPIAETMRALEELVDAGKVRFIGVSNFSRREIEEAQAAMTRHRIVANQIEYSLVRRTVERDFDFYAREKITVIAYSPFAQGELLTQTRRRGYEVLQAVAAESGHTLAQVALNWCLSRPNVITIPKSDRVERVEENCLASGWSLTPEQVAALDRAYN